MTPTTSIVISNHNYEPFVGAAIESALAQRCAEVEVIVVDDASTDGSAGVVAAFGDAIEVVRHASNRGQAAAVNSGFAAARGRIIHFLDADDVLLPDAAWRVARALKGNPGTARVQFRLGYIDEGGEPLRGTTPPRGREMPSGNLRRQALHFPHDIRCPPMSGNAFPRWALERILPIPAEEYGLVLADLYLLNLTSLYGEVQSLDEVLGCYRRHGTNRHHRADIDLQALRGVITRNRISEQHIRAHARALGLVPANSDGRWQLSVTDLASRLTSLRLDGDGHPLAGDTTLSLVSNGVRASLRRFDEPVWRRAAIGAWFVVAGLSPAFVVEKMAQRALVEPV